MFEHSTGDPALMRYYLTIALLFLSTLFSPLFSESEEVFYVDATISGEFADGIENGAYYRASGALRPLPFFSLKASIQLGKNIPAIQTFRGGFDIRLLPPLSVWLYYHYYNQNEVRIHENNILLGLTHSITVPAIHWWNPFYSIGIDSRILDFDYDSNDSRVYGQDWLSEFFVVFQLGTNFKITPRYKMSLILANFDTYTLHSSNYWQFEQKNYINLNSNLQLTIEGGFSYSGSLPFAGNVNRGWAGIGMRYAQ